MPGPLKPVTTVLLDFALQYTQVLVPLFFIGFFFATAVAITFHRKRYVRKGYVAGLVSALLVTSMILSFAPLPLVHWHKFSSPQEQTQTLYQYRVVDTQNNELAFDAKATLSGDAGMSMHLLHHSHMSRSPQERRVVMQHLLNESRDYRSHLEDPSMLRFLRFPPHSGVWTQWRPETIDDYDRFVGIRLYKMTVTTSSDGQRITSLSETMLDEHFERESNGTRASTGNADSAVARTDRAQPPVKQPSIRAEVPA
ncbi:hypothetical protein NDI54_09430 [Haloarcula sp. S1AR25-5A]|uniref:Uncharacterized protein n=1 Tax=Haloarcula terrestris TaxID=2950533 RepID=A0AAE4JIS0_9EURY|nr:hypothetical protein [Haloarcula terrestris]MDS0221569.1 hypothetical protein [Haloarcula terrestris]